MQQAGALPYRLLDGRLEILLVTSRSSGQWILPKGMIDPGHSPQEAAEEEAWEEAGVSGRLGECLGSYEYRKYGRRLSVAMYPLAVLQISDCWLEQGHRAREWFPAMEVPTMMREPALGELVARFLAEWLANL